MQDFWKFCDGKPELVHSLLQRLVIQALNCMLETQVTFSMLLCLLKQKNP